MRTRERENKHKLPLAAAKATQRLNDRKLRTLKTARMRVREQQGETERESEAGRHETSVANSWGHKKAKLALENC